MKYLIPTGTEVETADLVSQYTPHGVFPPRGWRRQVTQAPMEFVAYLSFGNGLFTFRLGDSLVRVRTKDTEGTWGR